QQLAVLVLQELIGQQQRGEALVLDRRLIDALGTLLNNDTLDQAMVAEMLSLPSEAYLAEICDEADVDAIHAAREFVRRQIAEALYEPLWARYQANRELSRQTPYVAEASHIARRSLQNIALGYLMEAGREEVVAACLEPSEHSDKIGRAHV